MPTSIDQRMYPHLIDLILEQADMGSLLAMRTTSTKYRDKVDTRLFECVAVLEERLRHRQRGVGFGIPLVANVPHRWRATGRMGVYTTSHARWMQADSPRLPFLPWTLAPRVPYAAVSLESRRRQLRLIRTIDAPLITEHLPEICMHLAREFMHSLPPRLVVRSHALFFAPSTICVQHMDLSWFLSELAQHGDLDHTDQPTIEHPSGARALFGSHTLDCKDPRLVQPHPCVMHLTVDERVPLGVSFGEEERTVSDLVVVLRLPETPIAIANWDGAGRPTWMRAGYPVGILEVLVRSFAKFVVQGCNVSIVGAECLSPAFLLGTARYVRDTFGELRQRVPDNRIDALFEEGARRVRRLDRLLRDVANDSNDVPEQWSVKLITYDTWCALPDLGIGAPGLALREGERRAVVCQDPTQHSSIQIRNAS